MSATNRTEGDPLEKSHRDRSDFIRRLVQDTDEDRLVSATYLTKKPPKRVIHFWHDLDQLPDDVEQCIGSWTKLQKLGFDRHLFDSTQAKGFICRSLGERYKRAFEKCYHPAMQSDYFRLCYIFTEGGCYVDSDDVYLGVEVDHLFSDGRLKLQPLCYDMSTDEMVPPAVFKSPRADSLSWIFYFNNNPLIAANGHPVVGRALMSATTSLEEYSPSHLPDIQSTTGPGNLSKAVFDIGRDTSTIEDGLLVMRDWEHIAATQWPLSYRNDGRNWRLSNCRAYWSPNGQGRMGEET